MTATAEPEAGPAGPPSGGAARKWRRRLLALIIGVVMALALAEVVLRIAWPGGSGAFWTADDTYGRVLVPGVEGTYRREGTASVRINSHGFRDVERSMAKPPDTVRVAVLGDSFAEAVQVERSAAFPAVLERELDGHLPEDLTVEVLNFGVAGYSPTQQLLLLQDRVLGFEPDVVLVAFFTLNDVSDNLPALSAHRELPFFRLEDGRLVLDGDVPNGGATAQRGSVGRWAYRTFRLVQFVDETARNVLRCGQVADCFGTGDVLEGGGPIRNDVFRPPPDADWEEAWRLTEAIIVALRDRTVAAGADFGLVSLSAPIQVHPDPRIRAEFADAVGATDLFYPDRRLADLAAEVGFPALLLAPEMQTAADASGTYFHGFDPDGFGLGVGHWNEAGHRLAGELIAQWTATAFSRLAVAG